MPRQQVSCRTQMLLTVYPEATFSETRRDTCEQCTVFVWGLSGSSGMAMISTSSPDALHVQLARLQDLRLFMPFAIELYFDARTETRIRTLWNTLVRHGARPERHNASRPHVSLAVCENLNLEKASALVSRFAAEHEQFPLVFSAVGVFPGGKSVLFLTPKVTPQLLTFHQQFHQQFQKVADGIWDHYTIERWNPHCTLTTRLAKAQFGKALEDCCKFEFPLPGTVMHIGIIELRPVRPRFVAPLRSLSSEEERV